MSCRKTLRMLPLHVGGDLDRARAADVYRHLASCESCAAEFEIYENSRQQLFALKGEAVPPAPDLWPSVRLRLGTPPVPRRWRPARAAAAILLAAAGAVGIMLSLGSGEGPIETPELPALADRTPAVTAETPAEETRPLVGPDGSMPAEFMLAEVGPSRGDAIFDSDAFPSVVPAEPERTGWDEF